MVMSNLNSGNSEEPPPGHNLRILVMLSMMGNVLRDDAKFDQIMKQLDRMVENPDMKHVAVLGMLGVGIFDKMTFNIYRGIHE